MPAYEYFCEICGYKIEKIQKIKEVGHFLWCTGWLARVAKFRTIF